MERRTTAATLIAVYIGAVALTGCGASESDAGRDMTTAPRINDGATTTAPDGSNGADRADVDPDQEFPDVLAAELTPSGDGYRISVTISSPYDTPERYADGWRVLAPDGDVLAEHDLAHDHANEQPFTRTRGPFDIPGGIDEVTVEGRDRANGYGGGTVTVPVPGEGR